MRKYLIGTMFGIALTLTSSVFADDIKSLVGKAIQGEFAVKLEGETLEKKAIVIDGSSYLPVKAIADSLGLDATFDKVTGIELKKREAPMTSPETTINPTPTEQVYPPNIIDLNIRTLSTFIGMDKLKIDKAPEDPKVEEWKAEQKKFEDELVLWEARKAALTN